MREDLKQIEKIEMYLNGELSERDRLDFEQSIANDPVLEKQVANQKMVLQSIRRNVLSKQIQSVSNEKGGYLKFVWSIVILASILVGIYAWNHYDFQSEQVSDNGGVNKDFVHQLGFMLDTSDQMFVDEANNQEEERSEKHIPALDEKPDKSVAKKVESAIIPDETPAIEPPHFSSSAKKDSLINQSELVENEETVEVLTPELTDVSEVQTTSQILNRKASFPGGDEALRDYIETFSIEPTTRRREGVIYIDFVIGKDGQVTDVQIFKGVSKKINKQAVRLVKEMPDWIPAVKNGEPIVSTYRLPIILGIRE